MAGPTSVSEPRRHIVITPPHLARRGAVRRGEEVSSVEVLLFQWLTLFAILLTSLWAFLGSAPE